MIRRLVLLGAPGAGKGTQAAIVAREADLVHLSTGDLLRAAVAAGTPAGRQAGEHMAAGRLVPDEIVFEVLFERLGDGRAGFVLDGFPRNEAQAVELDRRLARLRTPLELVVDIDVPDRRLVARLSGRRVCGACGRSFHVEFVPPAREGACDGCGGALTQRNDDRPAVVSERLAVYHRQTAPLRNYYRQRSLLASVDGDRDVREVTSDLLARLSTTSAGQD